MVKGIEHIAICAADTTALKEWYIRLFAFRQVYDNGKGTFFLMAPDGAMIEFIKSSGGSAKTEDRAWGIRHLALAVDSFEEMVGLLIGEGVEVVTPPTVSPTGIKTFFFRDPEGNILHLIDRPEPLY